MENQVEKQTDHDMDSLLDFLVVCYYSFMVGNDNILPLNPKPPKKELQHRGL